MAYIEIFDQIVENVKLKLENDNNLSDIRFVSADRFKKKQTPLKDTYVTLGIYKIKCLNTAFGNYIGQTGGNDLFGKRVKLCIGFKIYCSQNANGNNCSEVFSKICSNLFFEDGTYKIMSISCNEVYHDNNAGAFTLDGTIEIDSLICKNETEQNVSDIKVEGVI